MVSLPVAAVVARSGPGSGESLLAMNDDAASSQLCLFQLLMWVDVVLGGRLGQQPWKLLMLLNSGCPLPPQQSLRAD